MTKLLSSEEDLALFHGTFLQQFWNKLALDRYLTRNSQSRLLIVFLDMNIKRHDVIVIIRLRVKVLIR